MHTRKLNYLSVAILYYFLSFTTLIFSQKSVTFFELNEKQGLSNAIVNSIVQDSLGYVWAGTEDGLFRFNGNKFTAFDEQRSYILIPNNTINALKVDRKNRIWILTNNGIGIYDYTTDTITYLLKDESGLFPEEKIFTAIAEANDGTIFLGNSAGGIYRYTNNELTAVNIVNSIDGIDFNNLNISDFEIKGNTLWLATWYHGIFQLDIETYHIKQSDSHAKEISYNMHDVYFHKDRLWVGTNNGLKYFETNALHDFVMQDFNFSFEDEILSVFQDAKEALWVGTRNKGLYKFIPNGKNDFYLEKQYDAGMGQNTISHRTISTIFEDRIGRIWLGTHSKGINVFDPLGETITQITPPVKELLLGNYITSIRGLAESRNKGIWFATDGAGLYHYNSNLKEPTKIASTNGPLVLNDDAILTIKETKDKKLWLGTYSGGINIIDLETKKTKRFTKQENSLGLQSNDIRTIHEDKDAVIWIGTNRGGLHFYDSTKATIKFIPESVSLDIRAILDDEDNPNILWLATYGDGLIKFDKTTRDLSKYNWSSENKKELPIALSMVHFKERIWIGTKNRGFICFNRNTETFETPKFQGKLESNTIRGMVAEKEHLWCSTNRGLSLLDFETKKITNYNAIDGVNFSQFNDGSALFTSSGNLAFGSINGLTIFDPKEILEPRLLPKITFTDLIYNNEPLTSAQKKEIMASSLPIEEDLHFKSDLDIFSIELSVLDFDPFHTRNYSYQLTGYDKNWSYTTDTDIVTYRNVPPGSYEFQARFRDEASGALGPIKKIRIHIAPPFWRTHWAYLFYLVSGILLLLWGYRYNNEKVAIKQKLYYEQMMRQQEQNSMEEKIRFYTNFSHELRTPITLILGPVNDLLNSGSLNQRQQQSLNFVKRNANTLLRLINRLLDFRKIETENIHLYVGEYDLSALGNEEFASFEYLAKERNIHFKYTCSEEVKAWVDIEKIQIVLNNLLSNAIKLPIREKLYLLLSSKKGILHVS
ncbi:two-component regulator propeller domain-containing protein [Tenacibaculum sp. SG-28]|uniref:sensor histidine kinase n=1 Tax=Tenacibaculum sp. SG-28 TaxID=754426 RepID=UPI000CF5818D|nr:two-component regulator propeller domain-containing protein [Tenacibaculum sp. SG-28]PQJ20807.1 hypothetical protein BSU00_11080 [Tenacibaculum sp. SG-28]